MIYSMLITGPSGLPVLIVTARQSRSFPANGEGPEMGWFDEHEDVA
ncbi:hypothetical protein [Arthrobacter sp. Z4-13]